MSEPGGEGRGVLAALAYEATQDGCTGSWDVPRRAAGQLVVAA